MGVRGKRMAPRILFPVVEPFDLASVAGIADIAPEAAALR